LALLPAIYNLALLGRLRDAPGPFDPAVVRRILVVRNDNIGDVLCSTPALDALRAAFPRAHIAALVCTLAQEVIEGHRALDELFVYPKAKHRQYGVLESHGRLLAVLGRIRRRRFDLAVALRNSFSTSQAWLTYASGARWRLGPRAQSAKQRWGFFYNLPADWPPPDQHEVLRCFHLLRHIGLDSPDKRLYLKIPDASRAKVAEFLASCGLDRGQGPVVLNITRWAYRPECSWPEHKYRALAQALAQRPDGLVVTHAPGDRAWVEGILAGLRPAVPTFWSPSLKDFAACLARARAVISAEGGPMHLVAAVNKPLVVMWSSTPLSVWKPWGIPCQVLGATGPIEGISVEEVLAALERLPASAGPSGTAGQ
jgi:ADP-heptose:LPS heptosyltransferase